MNVFVIVPPFYHLFLASIQRSCPLKKKNPKKNQFLFVRFLFGYTLIFPVIYFYINVQIERYIVRRLQRLNERLVFIDSDFT